MLDGGDEKEAIEVGALVFAETQSTFRPAEFGKFLSMAGVLMDADAIHEILCGLVERGALREVGPGLYAKACGTRLHG